MSGRDRISSISAAASAAACPCVLRAIISRANEWSTAGRAALFGGARHFSQTAQRHIIALLRSVRRTRREVEMTTDGKTSLAVLAGDGIGPEITAARSAWWRPPPLAPASILP